MKFKLPMNEMYILLALGLVAGIFSGLVGIGGGLIIVPVLVYFLNFTQHQAQGTALFMFLFPIGVLGVMNYWQKGFVDWRVALVIAITFIAGSFLGSKIAVSLDKTTVQRIFGVVMFALSIKMILGK
jgi:uncharacterized protein